MDVCRHDLDAINDRLWTRIRDEKEFQDMVELGLSRQSTSMEHLEKASDRIEQSQHRLEQQMQEILFAQQHYRPPIVCKSLNASSPDGRLTWMELGRLMRDEGISPEQIRKHPSELVSAMKATLAKLSQASVSTASFCTAREGSFGSMDGVLDPSCKTFTSTCMLSSKPRAGSLFPDYLSDEQHQADSVWEDDDNIDRGISSLLKGMEIENSISKEERPESFEFEDEHRTTVAPVAAASSYVKDSGQQSHDSDWQSISTGVPNHGMKPVIESPKLELSESSDVRGESKERTTHPVTKKQRSVSESDGISPSQNFFTYHGDDSLFRWPGEAYGYESAW